MVAIEPIDMGPDTEEIVSPVVDDEAAMHAAILTDPADSAPWLVYADWLQDRDFVDQAFMARQFRDTTAPRALLRHIRERRSAPANIRRQTGSDG